MVDLLKERDFEDVPRGEEDDEEGKSGKSYVQTLSEFMSTFGQKLSDKIENFVESRYGPITEMYVYKNTKDVVWTIDDRSRKIFPVVFLFLQIIYWTSYLYIMWYYKLCVDSVSVVVDLLGSPVP